MPDLRQNYRWAEASAAPGGGTRLPFAVHDHEKEGMDIAPETLHTAFEIYNPARP